MFRNVFNFTTVSINGAAQRTKGKEMRPTRARDFEAEVFRCLIPTGLKMLTWIGPYTTYRHLHSKPQTDPKQAHTFTSFALHTSARLFPKRTFLMSPH